MAADGRGTGYARTGWLDERRSVRRQSTGACNGSSNLAIGRVITELARERQAGTETGTLSTGTHP